MHPQLIWGSYKIRLDDLPDEAWEYIVGGSQGQTDLRKYYREVAWLNRGVHLRANHLIKMPFTIYRGKTEIDTSQDYQNKLMFLPNLKRLLWLTEAGLTLSGKSYLRIERKSVSGRGVPFAVHNMTAASITPEYSDETGDLEKFRRKLGSRGVIDLLPEDVLYFWAPDDSVEIGPPSDYPALAALQAAGVLHSVANFANMFFERGAIKVTLLTTKGNIVEAERSRLKTWWDRIRGKAWASEIINADQIEAIPIGEGLESLDNTELTREQREDIATALGVPHSMLFSNAANYATSVQDKQNFYEDTIIPECEFVQEVWNEQLLEPLGYRLVFRPESLSIFQEDEEQRSAAFYNFVQADVRPSIAGQMLGLDMPEGIDYSALDEKYEMSLSMTENLADNNPFENDDEESEDETGPKGTDEKAYMYIDLEKWQRKALNLIGKGKDPACEFESAHIPPLVVASIEGALESTTNNPQLVRDVFADPFLGYP